MRKLKALALGTCIALAAGLSAAQTPAPAKPTYDAALAAMTGADDNGMRAYVFVLLKTGPNRIPAGPERDEMFKGHFANINRLASEGKLALAGPFDGVDGWRGLYIFAVADIDEVKKLVETDPVVAKGEMVPEFHKYYGSAGLMVVNGVHSTLTKK
ncbi:MAG TPA: YciI family protein [Ramlibacter sp.]|nr:YciI family protein [Ramlibacter sp.]